jgi:hypothetical protein
MMDNLEMKQNNGIGLPMFAALKYGGLKNASAEADNIISDYIKIYTKTFEEGSRELKKRLRSIKS